MRSTEHTFRSGLWGMIVASCWASLVAAEPVLDAPPPSREPLYRVQRTMLPVRVDGRLDEAAWRAAPRIDRFVFPWHEAGKREQTVARLLWDDRCLYVAFECDDAHIWAEHERRDSPVYQDDCVELFTAPDPARSEAYFNFEMNARAALLDQRHPEGRYSGLDVPWDSQGVAIAVRWRGTLNDDTDLDQGWTLEAAIPWHNFRGAAQRLPPQPGDFWRMNLNRCGGNTNEQYSQWTSSRTPRPDFHVPEAFGWIEFEAPASITRPCWVRPCKRWPTGPRRSYGPAR